MAKFGSGQGATDIRVMAWGLAVVGACLGGCGSDGDASPPVNPEAAPITITFLRHDNPNYVTADREFYADYKQSHPNVTIQDTTVGFAALATMLLADLKRDQFAYDFVLIPPSRVCGFAGNLQDVPADVLTMAEAQNLFFPAPLAGSTCGGKLKGIPIEYNLEYGGVVVNLEKYAAKFPGKTPAWPDWPSFIRAASMLSEYDAQGNPAANGLDIDPGWPPAAREIFFSQILQRGGQYWGGPNGDLLDLTTPQARDTLIEMVSWVADHKIMFLDIIPPKNTHVTTRLASGATGYGWSDPTKPLSVMGYVGTAGVPSTRVQVPAGARWTFDYFPVPPMVGTEHRFVQDSGWSFAVPRTLSPEKSRVAWDIIRALALSPAAMRKWSAVTGALPALRENGSPAAAADNSNVQKVQHLLPRGQWLGFVPVEAFEQFAGAVASNYFAAVAGTKSIDQALADMQQAANNAIISSRGN